MYIHLLSPCSLCLIPDSHTVVYLLLDPKLVGNFQVLSIINRICHSVLVQNVLLTLDLGLKNELGKKLLKKTDGILHIPFLLFHEKIRLSVTVLDMLVVSEWKFPIHVPYEKCGHSVNVLPQVELIILSLGSCHRGRKHTGRRMNWCFLEEKKKTDQSISLYEIWNDKHGENKPIKNGSCRWKVLKK